VYAEEELFGRVASTVTDSETLIKIRHRWASAVLDANTGGNGWQHADRNKDPSAGRNFVFRPPRNLGAFSAKFCFTAASRKLHYLVSFVRTRY